MSSAGTSARRARKPVLILVAAVALGVAAIPAGVEAVEAFQKVVVADQTTGALARVDGDAAKTVSAPSRHSRHWQHIVDGSATLYGPEGGAINLVSVVMANSNPLVGATVNLVHRGYGNPTSATTFDCDPNRGYRKVLSVRVPAGATETIELNEPLWINNGAAYDFAPYRACLVVEAPAGVTVTATGFTG